MRRGLLLLAALAVTALAAFWWLTRPAGLTPGERAQLAGLTGDAGRGRRVFLAGGCASCHAAKGQEEAERPLLSGGRALVTPFGTFRASNISNDPKAGIGAWSTADLARALLRGVSPDGRPYYPAFPYWSYSRMTLQEVADLRAYLATLPAAATPSPAHDLPLPLRLRRGVGLWQRLFMDPGPVIDPGGLSPAARRGQRLVEGLGHCAECHTPRGLLGNPLRDRWLAGAENPAGRGRIPSLRAPRLDWSAADIAEYLKTGFTPEYDSAGGAMAEVIANTSRLSDRDRADIAAYLKALPPL